MGQAMTGMPGAGLNEPYARRLLIVDDDQEVSRVIASMIEQLGHQVAVCGSAQDALARTPLGKYDMMLIDYRMPELTGLDLISMLREENCLIPVILMTGFTATEERVSLEKLGIVGILRKPILMAPLSRAIDECLGLSRPS